MSSLNRTIEHRPLLPHSQIKRLEALLKRNKDAQRILNTASTLKMPNWYLAAGGISQTVWNIFHAFEPTNGIKDYDVVYYDSSDLSYRGEDDFIQKGKQLFQEISVPVEVRNQARVHLWYPERFGYEIKPHQNVEDAIRTFPATATCVGVKYVGGHFHVYAPYGLDDLFSLIVRPNRSQVAAIVGDPEKAREVYEAKVERWRKIWPMLHVIRWER